MNRGDIIRMAREAGFHKWYTQPEEHPDHVAIVGRFAHLVAAAEREACARAADGIYRIGGGYGAWDAAAIRARSGK